MTYHVVISRRVIFVWCAALSLHVGSRRGAWHIVPQRLLLSFARLGITGCDPAAQGVDLIAQNMTYLLRITVSGIG